MLLNIIFDMFARLRKGLSMVILKIFKLILIRWVKEGINKFYSVFEYIPRYPGMTKKRIKGN